MDKLLTIIIPTYNMEVYLARCLDSIIINDIELLDVIVVNDGSTDHSHDIAQEYAERFPDSIRILDKENGHYGTTINAGMKAARGKYFRIMDSDDYFEEGQLQVFIDRLKHCDTDIVFTNKVEENLNNNLTTIIKAINIEFDKVYDYKNFFFTDYSKNGIAFNMHTLTYKTDILKKKNFALPGGVCYTDSIFCLIPQDSLKTVIVYDINLYHYIIGRVGSSTTNRSVRRNFEQIIIVLDFMIQYCKTNPTTEKSVFENRKIFFGEAFSIFYSSILQQKYITNDYYIKINNIIRYCREIGVSSRNLKKYYVKYWYFSNSRQKLNTSLLIYHLGHPFK